MRQIRQRVIAAFVALLAIGGVLLVAGSPASAATKAPTAKSPRYAATSTVSGTATDASGAVYTIAGTFTPTSFVQQNGSLAAVGQLSTTATNTVTGATTSLPTSTQTLAVAQAVASCQILHLVLGPLDLNLLGLVVHLNQVVLDITAVPGAGNLLGNLLCAVAGLLNGGSPLSNLLNALTALLNQILGGL